MTFAKTVEALIDSSMRDSKRSEFAQTKLGVSDIGHCREYARRVIEGVPRDGSQGSYLAAFVGTAVGALIEKEFAKTHPNAITQATVLVTLRAHGFLLKIPGHPDLVLPADDGNRIVDFKTQNGLGVARNGADLQQKFQVSLYAKALIEMGVLDEQCLCTVAFIDRSGADPEVVVDEWTYDPAIVEQAEEWLTDVIYAVVNKEEASKDKPRSWCWAACDFAPSCRGEDSDVEGLIEDPVILNAIAVYKEATAAVKAAEKDKESAKSVLQDVAGRTADWTVRWIEIPGSTYTVDKRASRRLDISPNRPPKRVKKDG